MPRINKKLKTNNVGNSSFPLLDVPCWVLSNKALSSCILCALIQYVATSTTMSKRYVSHANMDYMENSQIRSEGDILGG